MPKLPVWGGELKQTGRVRAPQVIAKGEKGTKEVAVCPGAVMIYGTLSEQSCWWFLVWEPRGLTAPGYTAFM